MFNFFKKDPLAKMRKQYDQLMLEARDLQRGGNIKGYAAKVSEAEALMQQIEALVAQKNSTKG